MENEQELVFLCFTFMVFISDVVPLHHHILLKQYLYDVVRIEHFN